MSSFGSLRSTATLMAFRGKKPPGGNKSDLTQQQLQAQLGEGSGCVHTSAGTTAWILPSSIQALKLCPAPLSAVPPRSQTAAIKRSLPLSK